MKSLLFTVGMGKQAVCAPGVKNSSQVGTGMCVPSASLCSTSWGKRYQSVVCILFVYVCIAFLGSLRGFVEITGAKHNLQVVFKQQDLWGMESSSSSCLPGSILAVKCTQKGLAAVLICGCCGKPD